MSSAAARYLPSIPTVLRAALWSVLFAVITYTRADPDLWGHVRFGLDFLEERVLPTADPYSFTSDRPWINHEWAAELLTAAAFHLAGPAGLVVLKVAVIAGVWWQLDLILRREGIVQGRRRDWLAAAAVITTVQQAHHVRPQLFSLLFFTALVVCLLRSSKAEGRRWLMPLPIVFGLWANFHGGWIVGGAVLMLWTAGAAVRYRTDGLRPSVRLVAAGAASLAATLANPYGLGMWQFLWETVGFGRADIADWQPIYALDHSVWLLWIATAVLAAAGLVRTRSCIDHRRALVVVGLAAGSFFVNRLLGFFALSTLFLYGAALLPRREPESPTSSAAVSRGGRAVSLALGVAMIAGALAAVVVNIGCIHLDPRTTPEAEAVAVLRQQPQGSRLLVWFDWGQYAIWHLSPGLRVSTDGRRETVYSAALHDRHLRFFFDAPGGSGLPRELDADYVWIPHHLPSARRLREVGWTVLHEGEQSVVFGRPGIPPVPAARRDSPRVRCFPSP